MSVLGNIGKYESFERHRSPSVEIFIDDDNIGHPRHDDNRSQRANYSKSAGRRSSQVSPFTTTDVKPTPDRYQQALNKKYSELKRLVLEAVSFSGKAPRLNQNVKEQPQFRVRKNRRERNDELTSKSPEMDEFKRSQPRRSEYDRQSYSGQEKEDRDIRQTMRNSSTDEQSDRGNRYENRLNQLRRVTFDDSFRISSASAVESQKSMRRRIDIEMPSSEVSPRSRGRSRRNSNSDVIFIVADEPRRNRRSVVDSSEQDGSEDMDRDRGLKLEVNEQDVVYYTRQLPRRKIKATTSRSVKIPEKQGAPSKAALEKSPVSNPVKSKSIVDASNARRRSRDSYDAGSAEKGDDNGRSRLKKRSDRNNNAEESSHISPSAESPNGRASMTTLTVAEYHLKYTENGKIRDWLRDKNRLEKKRRRDERRILRAKQLEKQRQEEAKAERKKISDSVVSVWLDEKRKDEKTANTKETRLAPGDLRGSVEAQDARVRRRPSKSPNAPRTTDDLSQIRGSSLRRSHNAEKFEKKSKLVESDISSTRSSKVLETEHILGDDNPSKRGEVILSQRSSSSRCDETRSSVVASSPSEKPSSRRRRLECRGAAVDDGAASDGDYRVDRRFVEACDEFDDVMSEEKLSLTGLSLDDEKID